MQIEGKRVTRTRLVRTERYVVAVDVSMLIPTEDPSEPCIDSAGVELLREVQQRAEADDVEWLKSHGKVYAAVEAS
jgi:hypothetical protein